MRLDGTYVGFMTLLKGPQARCPAGQTITIVVKDGKVPVSWRKEPAEAVVQPDTYNWSLKRQP
jgi:hypothetical protein